MKRSGEAMRLGAMRVGAMRVGAVAGLTACLVLAGCGDDGSTDGATTKTTAATAAPAKVDLPKLSYELVDYGFDGPTEATAGAVELVVHGAGDEAHQLQLARLNDGVTEEQIDGALHGPIPDAVSSMVTFVGGISALDPGGSASAMVTLDEGSYVLLCFFADATGTSHLAHGMFKYLEVGPAAKPTAKLPKASNEMALADMTISVPSDFDGHGVMSVVNAGPQTHEAGLARLNDGATEAQATAYLTAGTKGADGKPPMTLIGGPGAISPGKTEQMDFDLDPGTYVFFCAIPDTTKNFTPHMLEGMITTVTVS